MESESSNFSRERERKVEINNECAFKIQRDYNTPFRKRNSCKQIIDVIIQKIV